MIWIERRRPTTLFIPILIRHNEDQVPTRLDQPPPVEQPFEWIMQMLKAMGGKNQVKTFVRQASHKLRITVSTVPASGVRHYQIRATANIKY